MISIQPGDPSIPHYLRIIAEVFSTVLDQSEFFVEDPNQYTHFWLKMVTEDFSSGCQLVAHPSHTAAAILGPYHLKEDNHIDENQQPSPTGSYLTYLRPQAGPLLKEINQTRVDQEKKYFEVAGPFIILREIAASPLEQGKGYGGELLDRIIDMSNTIKKNIFLVAISPRLANWYETKGFKRLFHKEWSYVDSNGKRLVKYSCFMGRKYSEVNRSKL